MAPLRPGGMSSGYRSCSFQSCLCTKQPAFEGLLKCLQDTVTYTLNGFRPTSVQNSTTRPTTFVVFARLFVELPPNANRALGRCAERASRRSKIWIAACWLNFSQGVGASLCAVNMPLRLSKDKRQAQPQQERDPVSKSQPKADKDTPAQRCNQNAASTEDVSPRASDVPGSRLRTAISWCTSTTALLENTGSVARDHLAVSGAKKFHGTNAAHRRTAQC